jgi:hypothetical protein
MVGAVGMDPRVLIYPKTRAGANAGRGFHRLEYWVEFVVIIQ